MPYKDIDDKRAYQRRWIAERRARWFRDKQCAKCGSKESLELDHVYPELKETHRIWSYSWKKIMEETAKCQVLCHNCHWEKTKQDMNYKLEHGTTNGYSYYGCRCDACRKANTDAKREARHKKKSLWAPYFAGATDYEPA